MPDWDFTALNPAMYNYSTSVNVFDQSGESHVLTMYFVRQSDGGAEQRDWMPHYVLDSKYEIPATLDAAAATPATALRFLPNGQIDTASASAFYLDFANAKDATGAAIVLNDTTNTPPGLAMFDPLIPVQVDFALATQFGAAYDVNRLDQDGYGPGRLAGISIDKEGMVLGRYSNGQAKLMGQITLTTFQNPNGLVSQGGNMWAPSSASGQALEGSPNAGSRGLIQSASVEDSNVDLTQELVQLITQQRAYQANAQTIKTQDSVLQTLVNLR
jgi:flagellar hook protein FlgE